MNTLPESERLKGKTSISALMSKGRWGFTSGLKYCSLSGEAAGEEAEANSIMVSVPKRLFRRAVRRNLLKRRMREAYRTQKTLLSPSGTKILFLYNTREILDYETIRSQIATILNRLQDEGQQ